MPKKTDKQTKPVPTPEPARTSNQAATTQGTLAAYARAAASDQARLERQAAKSASRSGGASSNLSSSDSVESASSSSDPLSSSASSSSSVSFFSTMSSDPSSMRFSEVSSIFTVDEESDPASEISVVVHGHRESVAPSTPPAPQHREKSVLSAPVKASGTRSVTMNQTWRIRPSFDLWKEYLRKKLLVHGLSR
jgi:hypothetical protein